MWRFASSSDDVDDYPQRSEIHVQRARYGRGAIAGATLRKTKKKNQNNPFVRLLKDERGDNNVRVSPPQTKIERTQPSLGLEVYSSKSIWRERLRRRPYGHQPDGSVQRRSEPESRI